MEREHLWNILVRSVPRILGQIDRDPDSPSFGSCDRNYWNYKIRDFSSSVLQQALIVLDVVINLEIKNNPYYGSQVIKDIINGGIVFWSKIQNKTGGHNEYYPGEDSVPASAFSLLAMSILYTKKRYIFDQNVLKSIQKSCDFLLNYNEKQALNQECAAITALKIIEKNNIVKIDTSKLEAKIQSFFSSQQLEGWFEEYGGADIGYLSVTIDCLYDYYSCSKEIRALNAATLAISFIEKMLGKNGQMPSMINSRNTDYVLPYGLASFMTQYGVCNKVFSSILVGLESIDNQFIRTDDRYLCHYIGQSFFRCLENYDENSFKLSRKISIENSSIYFPKAGLFVEHFENNTYYCSLGKGGVSATIKEDLIVDIDSGSRFINKNKIAVSNWQSSDYKWSCRQEGGNTILNVEGAFGLHRYIRPTKITHLLLRLSTIFVRKKVIALTKNMLIFSSSKTNVKFHRVIKVSKATFTTTDSFSKNKDVKIYNAPPYSVRHVASANRFSLQEI